MKILTVENENVLAHLLQSSVLDHSYQIERAEDSQLGLQVLENQAQPALTPGIQAERLIESIATSDYDLIVLDAAWRDPNDVGSRLDGIGLCQRLRIKGVQIPILLLTEAGAEQWSMALKAGAQDYLTKPCDAESLFSRVAFLLHRNQPLQVRSRSQLLAEITDAIHQTLDLDEILQTAVTQVRAFLKADRVIVFRFHPDWQGVVEAESVAPEWNEILGMNIQDSCFNAQYVKSYRRGRISTISDINAIAMNPCYVALLKSVQARANLVVPIVQENKLWGLLISHQCGAPRQWTLESTQLLQGVATQLGIAIQQAELYQTTRRELVERRQMQQVLQSSEARFRSLSAFAPVGIYQTNPQGHYTYTNAKWQEIAGLTFEESLGDRWRQAIHPDDREKVFTRWEQLIAGESDFSLEFRFYQKAAQSERWVSGRAIAMQSSTGEIIGYVGVNEDITERKRAEHKIREQAALIDIATDAIFVRDLADRIVFWSHGAAQMYGWDKKEAIGQNVRQLFKTQGNINPDVVLATTLQQGWWQGELTHTTKSGNSILVASRWTLVRDDSGQPQSFLEVNTDITEKKQLEAKFYQAQRLESLGQLASGVAHDLGNVLTPILAVSQLLRMTLKDPNDKTQEHIKLLEKSAQRGTTMVRQILTFAQGSPDDGMPADIVAVLQEVVAVARQGIPNNIEIYQNTPDENALNPLKTGRLKISPLKTMVSVNSTHLYQVFMNLCINARDAMPEGGVLTLSVENITIDETTASQYLAQTVGRCSVGCYVVVSVADTGTGIAAEIRDRIFDPFFTTKAPDQGTGLGLATVIGIVKNAGGFLQVFSEVGRGSDIKAYFPVFEV